MSSADAKMETRTSSADAKIPRCLCRKGVGGQLKEVIERKLVQEVLLPRCLLLCFFCETTLARVGYATRRSNLEVSSAS